MKLKINKENLDKLEKVQESKTEKRGTVLIVDDEPSNLFPLRKLLTKNNFEVLSFENPVEALEAVGKQPIDIIITDQRMPQMLGTEFLTEAIKIDPDNVRFILTGYTDPQDLILCINHGLIYRFLEKPWKQNNIIQVVEDALVKIKKDRIGQQLVGNRMYEKLLEGSHVLNESPIVYQGPIARLLIQSASEPSASQSSIDSLAAMWADVMDLLGEGVIEHHFTSSVSVLFTGEDCTEQVIATAKRLDGLVQSANWRLSADHVEVASLGMLESHSSVHIGHLSDELSGIGELKRIGDAITKGQLAITEAFAIKLGKSEQISNNGVDIYIIPIS